MRRRATTASAVIAISLVALLGGCTLERAAAAHAETDAQVLRSCIAGNTHACTQSREGQRRLEQDCDAGGGSACRALGQLARGDRKDAPAADYFERACKLADANSCLAAAEHLRALDSAESRARARAVLTIGCEQLDSGEGCSELAWSYNEGLGGPHDVTTARALARRACGFESARGCILAGFYETQGIGGDVDASGGEAMLKRSCELDASQCIWAAFVAGSEGPPGVFALVVDEPHLTAVRVGPAQLPAVGDTVQIFSPFGGTRAKGWASAISGPVVSADEHAVVIRDASTSRSFGVQLSGRRFVALVTPASQLKASQPKPLTEREAEGWARGGHDLAAIERAVAANAEQIARCWQGASEEDLRGRVSIGLMIGPTGKVETTQAQGAEVRDRSIVACLEAEVKTWRFASPPDGAITVGAYPIARPGSAR